MRNTSPIPVELEIYVHLHVNTTDNEYAGNRQSGLEDILKIDFRSRKIIIYFTMGLALLWGWQGDLTTRMTTLDNQTGGTLEIRPRSPEGANLTLSYVPSSSWSSMQVIRGLV